MSKTLINKLIERTLVTLNESEKVPTAIKKLADHNIGAIPVINEDKKLSGILSERDIVKTLAKNDRIDFSQISIKELMTRPVISCNREALSNELMELMTKNKIRHIPIVENGVPIGIVSIGDVVNRLLEKFEYENQMLKEYLSG